MDREIKFRVWDEKYKSYVLWDEIRTTRMLSVFVNKNNRSAPWMTLEQYINKQDKHGADIYEGDILSIVSRTDSYSVIWSTGYCAFIFLGVQSSELITANRYSDIEIIGNLHTMVRGK